jgi:hypothetical protein
MVDSKCQCESQFTGESCEERLPVDTFLDSLSFSEQITSPPSYYDLGPKNCIAGVGCEYSINWDVGFATTTYYGAGCVTDTAMTGKCGTACRKGKNANYTAAIPLAYWPPIRYGNCPSCNFDCVWNGDVTQGGKTLCWKLTPYYASKIPGELPSIPGPGTPIVIQVTDSCGGNCPPGNPLTKGSCEGSSSPDCGNTALYEGAIAKATPPFKVYVGDDHVNPDPVRDGYRCLDAWECNAFGTKYWSPCSHGGWSVKAPGFLDWCAGKNMHIDVNTESLMDPLIEFCKGVGFSGNDASCFAKYERVECGPIPTVVKYTQGYSHWDNANSRNVYCCQQQTWGEFDTCEASQGTLPLCSCTTTGDCWQPTCGAS